MIKSRVNLWWIIADFLILIKSIKRVETDQLVRLCSKKVDETLGVVIEYRFNNPKFDEE